MEVSWPSRTFSLSIQESSTKLSPVLGYDIIRYLCAHDLPSGQTDPMCLSDHEESRHQEFQSPLLCEVHLETESEHQVLNGSHIFVSFI